jgi:glyoxylase-like metal-dependent hydrolase (beta-lactamase superfamily II)
MKDDSYRFKLGTFECLAISDGCHNYPLKSFFANAPLAEVEAALRERGDPVDVIRTPYTFLVVETGTHRVLVDTGTGGLFAETGHLVDNLRAAGITPGEIDAVVITHAHGDHIDGALNDAGRLAFAQARYYVSQREWTF